MQKSKQEEQVEQFAEAINRLSRMVENLQDQLKTKVFERECDKERIAQLRIDLESANAENKKLREANANKRSES